MSKVPATTPTTVPLLGPRDDEERPETNRLLAQDRKHLSSFVKNLNNAVTFDDMDDDLKAWWMNRY